MQTPRNKHPQRELRRIQRTSVNTGSRFIVVRSDSCASKSCIQVNSHPHHRILMNTENAPKPANAHHPISASITARTPPHTMHTSNHVQHSVSETAGAEQKGDAPRGLRPPSARSPSRRSKFAVAPAQTTKNSTTNTSLNTLGTEPDTPHPRTRRHTHANSKRSNRTHTKRDCCICVHSKYVWGSGVSPNEKGETATTTSTILCQWNTHSTKHHAPHPRHQHRTHDMLERIEALAPTTLSLRIFIPLLPTTHTRAHLLLPTSCFVATPQFLRDVVPATTSSGTFASARSFHFFR